MMAKIVLITGVAGGIGSATAKKFMSSDWTVIGTDLRETDVAGEIEFFIQDDLSDPERAESAFEEITGRFERIDALVNNAAVQICKPLVDTTPEDWDYVMVNNLRLPFLMVRNAYRLMKEHGGAIVNVSSVHAVATSANVAAYASSKGALLALTRALAIELAPDGIRVNAVLPGAVETDMLYAGLTRGHLSDGSIPKKLEELANKTVIGRVGQPEEIAEAIFFLANNDLSSFMTGGALIVDGGATTRLSTE